MARIAIDLSPEQVAELDRIAQEEGVTRDDLIRRILALHLERIREAADKISA